MRKNIPEKLTSRSAYLESYSNVIRKDNFVMVNTIWYLDYLLAVTSLRVIGWDFIFDEITAPCVNVIVSARFDVLVANGCLAGIWK